MKEKPTHAHWYPMRCWESGKSSQEEEDNEPLSAEAVCVCVCVGESRLNCTVQKGSIAKAFVT